MREKVNLVSATKIKVVAEGGGVAMYLKEQGPLPADGENQCADAVDGLFGSSRLDQLVALVDHCAAAKDIAESLNDTFLSYMLSMTILAARSEMRPKALRVSR
jgi:hypothetical protein